MRRPGAAGDIPALYQGFHKIKSQLNLAEKLEKTSTKASQKTTDIPTKPPIFGYHTAEKKSEKRQYGGWGAV